MAQTQRGFWRIFWGFLFVIIDFRLDGLDVIPDFVGFAIIAAGLGLVVPLNRRFLTAQIMAYLLIVLSLATLVEHAGQPTEIPNAWLYYRLVVSILDVVMVWQLCTGIIEVAREAGQDDLADVATTRRGLYVGLEFLSWLLLFLFADAPDPPGIMIFGLVVFALIVAFLMMGLMLRCSRELPEIE